MGRAENRVHFNLKAALRMLQLLRGLMACGSQPWWIRVKAEACHLHLELVMNLIVPYVFDAIYYFLARKIYFYRNAWRKGCHVSLHCSLIETAAVASWFNEKKKLMLTGGKLWWADEESAQLGTVTKRDGRNLEILRNKTSGVVHMKVYDREGQKGKQVNTCQNTNN